MSKATSVWTSDTTEHRNRLNPGGFAVGEFYELPTLLHAGECPRLSIRCEMNADRSVRGTVLQKIADDGLYEIYANKTHLQMKTHWQHLMEMYPDEMLFIVRDNASSHTTAKLDDFLIRYKVDRMSLFLAPRADSLGHYSCQHSRAISLPTKFAYGHLACETNINNLEFSHSHSSLRNFSPIT